MRISRTLASTLAVVGLVTGACSGATASPSVPSSAPSSAAASASGGSANPSASGSGGATTTAGLDEACTKGATEGAVSIWIDIDPDLFAKETAPFVEKYPQIKITQQSVRPTDSVPRVITDITAGRKPETDIVQGEAPLLEPLVSRSLIDTSFDWTTFGQGSDLLLNGMLRHYRTFRGLGYNTQTVQKSDLPNTWEELIDPKWAGQVMVDPRGYTFQDLGVAWGEAKTVDYVNRLKATVHPIVLKGITDDEVAIASGQAKLNTNIRDAETAEQQSKGAPVDIKYLDYVIVDDSYNAVVKGAAHPNAGACLVGWLNSKDGLDLQYQNEFKKNEDTLPSLPAGAQLVNIDTPEKATLDAKVAADVAKIWASK